MKSKANHDLLREPALLPLEPRLRFIGAYFYMADAGVLTDCRSGLQFPVAPGEAAHELEKAFLAATAVRDSMARLHEAPPQSGKAEGPPQNSPLLVSVQARVLSRPPAGIEGDKPMFLVERLFDTYPNETCEARGVRSIGTWTTSQKCARSLPRRQPCLPRSPGWLTS